jgi:signal transduction histidine kinase
MDFDKRRIEALTSKPAKDDTRFMVVTLVLGTAIFEADLMLPLGMGLWVPYVSLALLSVWSRHRKSVFILATVCTGFIILGFVYSPLRFSLELDLFNRSAGVLVIWVIAILSVQRVQAEEELRAAIAIHNSQLYEQSRKQAVELDRANRVKDEFLSVMSHELRTPLNVVMGYAGMMKDKLLGELSLEQEKSLEKIVSRAKDQIKLINRILQATQLETGVVKVEGHEIDLSHFLDELRLTYEGPLDKELTLYWDYPSDLPVVKTDGEKLEHVLENLINNAIKFAEKGYVTVSARIKEGSSQRVEGKWEVEFKVADTGIGIREEALPLIFERFHQADSSETRPYGGVGLGLYIVKKFTELLGGKVEVESEVGKGSTFTVTIPCEMYSSMVGQQTHSAENREPNA